jgi:hypothetical protein
MNLFPVNLGKDVDNIIFKYAHQIQMKSVLKEIIKIKKPCYTCYEDKIQHHWYKCPSCYREICYDCRFYMINENREICDDCDDYDEIDWNF